LFNDSATTEIYTTVYTPSLHDALPISETCRSCFNVKQSIKIHRCAVNTVMVWLHILGPYWCVYVALFGSRLS
jgi:hypothetical protein